MAENGKASRAWMSLISGEGKYLKNRLVVYHPIKFSPFKTGVLVIWRKSHLVLARAALLRCYFIEH